MDNYVQFSEKRLFTLFAEVDASKKRKSTEKEYLDMVNQYIPSCSQIIESAELTAAIRQFKKLRKNKYSSKRIIDEASNDIKLSVCIDEADKENAEPGEPVLKKSRGPKVINVSFSSSYKDFNELEQRQKRNVTAPLIDTIDKFIQQNHYNLTITQLLGYLITRENPSPNDPINKYGNQVFKQSCVNFEESFSLEEGVSLYHSLALSKEKARKVRQYLAVKDVEFPTTTNMLPVRKSFRPETKAVLNGKGRAADFGELIICTAASLIRVVKETDQNFNAANGTLTFHLKDGGDGAGTMHSLKSKKSVDDAHNIFQYGIIPLRLTQNIQGDEQEVWCNPVPNSSRSLRPSHLIRELETDADLLDLVIKETDQVRKEFNQNGIKMLVGGVEITLHCNIKDTMKDLKFKKKISGLGGADCLLCKSQAKDWTDKVKAAEGFKINRSAADTFAIYESVLDEDDEIIINPKDFGVRSGVTQRPLSDSDQHCITITHSYVNGCTWFMKLLYRCYADYTVWIEKAGYKHILSTSKDTVRDAIKRETGLMLDYVCSAGAKGGTSTDGKQGRRFFSNEVVPVLKNLLSKQHNKKHLENILKLHNQLSLVLRVISCTQKIDVPKFSKHCKETMSHIIDHFPWVSLNHTLHGAIQHSAELIEMNDGISIGWYSEEGLEANNKDIRNYLEHLTRKCDGNNQIEDAHHRLLERSDPYLIHVTSKFIQGKVCSVCDATDHTIRSHDKHVQQDIDGICQFFL